MTWSLQSISADSTRLARRALVAPPQLPVKHALLSGDAETLDAYGRFLDPIARRLAAAASLDERAAIESHLQRSAAAASSRVLAGCRT